ncbi:MAG: DivIVA domain-containing protein [Clostridia bacterium]|nr:DivIVA domain-containing protein [Clostridia bacterium]
MSERITISMIESKNFAMKPRGYDRDEVDAFLDDICDEMERMNNEMASLRQQLREAQAAAARPAAPQPVPVPAAAPAPAPVPAPAPEEGNDDLISVLDLAKRLRDETIDEAKKKAERIVADAEAQARDQLDSLSDERDSLTQQVEALRKSAADYRTRFNDLLKAQQEALEKISDL